jgi:PAS domain S-box-containing protein
LVPIELSSNALPDGRLRAFVRDISARREAEARLVQSEARLAGIVELAADAIISIDEHQHITLFNRGAERMFGYQAAEAIGAPLDVLLPERLRGRHREHVRAFAVGGAMTRPMGERGVRLVGLRKNGDEFPAEAGISRLVVGGRSLLTVSLHDLTDHERTENAQRFLARVGELLIAAGSDHARLLRDVADAVVQGLADWSVVDLVQAGQIRRLRVAHADPTKAATCAALEALVLDRSRPNLVTTAMRSRHPVLLADVSADYVRAVAQGPEHLRLLEELGVRSMVVIPLVAHGEALGTLTLGSSSARRRFGQEDAETGEQVGNRLALAIVNARLREALEQAVRARDEVQAVVAHDLRSPLNGLVLEATLLKRQRTPIDAVAGLRLADAVLRGAKRMDRLIQDLLDIARVESGQMKLAPRPLDPRGLIDDAIDAHRLAAEEAGVELVRAPLDALPPVRADAERLAQALGNLVGNALKFTPAGGRITLGARRVGTDVAFRVEDTGSGIPADALAHVFDRFWQVRRFDRRGAGLDLAIVKGIVEAHGGRITVESEPGAGTAFELTLPVARDE